ncbi:MAG TPA: site-specific DNA-methyltransferase [Gallicola sp.]|nr:site-specific DNA-methyltransferase [Gallicola sp.]
MLYLGDCNEVMEKIRPNSVDLIFADPPYFLSNDGLSINSGKIVSVNKGDWDKRENYSDIYLFTKTWISKCYKLLKSNGSIWISGTHHNIFDVKRALDEVGFKLINIVIWHKSDPPPLIYKNKFKFSHEIIIWAKKDRRHYFNYDEMFQVNNEEMGDVWLMPAVQHYEKTFGYHPTQKPEKLLERIILATSKPNDIVLDPFLGSGTTCAVAKKLGRRYIGIEKHPKYFKIASDRINSA